MKAEQLRALEEKCADVTHAEREREGEGSAGAGVGGGDVSKIRLIAAKPTMVDLWDDDIDDISLEGEELSCSVRDREAMRAVVGRSRDPTLALHLLRTDLFELEKDIDLRFDCAVCQIVSAIATGVVQRLILLCHMRDALTIRQYYSIGLLVHFESLLSTIGSEAGMLGDMEAAVRAGGRVVVSVCESDDPAADRTVVRISRCGDGDGGSGNQIEKEVRYSVPYVSTSAPLDPLYLLTVVLPECIFSKMRDVFKHPKETFRIVTVLFTQGINEQQSKAIMLGQTESQERINVENLAILRTYFQGYQMFRSEFSLQGQFDDLASAILNSKREKSVTILPRSADFARSLKALRMTSCKSAKDRTSMAITWEMARVLCDHGLEAKDVLSTADIMRAQVWGGGGGREEVGGVLVWRERQWTEICWDFVSEFFNDIVHFVIFVYVHFSAIVFEHTLSTGRSARERLEEYREEKVRFQQTPTLPHP